MVDRIGAISDVDAGRLRAIGVPSRKITVRGNTKFDSILSRVDQSAGEILKQELNYSPDEKILVAGSTHPGEEKIILGVFRGLLEKYPDFNLILAPRHVDRAAEVLSLIRAEGFDDVLPLSRVRQGGRRRAERIILVDMIGELFRLYTLASVVYCGGSLVPRGGQNIIEPAAWGKVVFCGPHMEDFTDEKNLLESVGSQITVHSGEELLQGILELLERPAELSRRGEAGREAVAASAGAARKYAELITSVLETRTKGERKE
jgi:3-deoxy-D-manno-octulosonic-acid transferase